MPSLRAWSTLRGSNGSPRRKSCPASGFWKPQMIFISVDLPAPLSPSRPRTSPLRRCMLMSRSAVTGPKRLLMCSTRRTSSDAAVGATTCSPLMPLSANARPLSYSSDVGVCGHRDDDRQAQVEAQVVGIDALDDQAIAQDAEEQRADQRTYHGARAAGQQGAADHCGGEAVEEHL